MENVFQDTPDAIFKKWYNLRTTLENQHIETICIEVDKWWQHAPLVSHYLHPDFIDEWPNPWELIYENHYCKLARGLGMVYTLLLLGITNIEFVEATDYNNEDVVLILVEDKKYMLNYWPNSVLNNNLTDFKITRYMDVQAISNRINVK